MKTFLKMFFASLLAGFAFIFLLFAFIGVVSLFGEDKPTLHDKSILTINFNAQIVDRFSDDPFGSFDFLSQSRSEKIGLNQIKEALKRAKDDEKIKALYLNFSGIQAGPATLKELRLVLEDFKEYSTIPIYSYAEVYTQKTLYLASVSDSIFLQPSGILELSGMSANVAFYKTVLNKMGIKPEIIRGSNNKFKSAVEPFIASEMSDANREQLETLFGDLWDEYKWGIAKNRGLLPEDIQAMTDSFAVQLPVVALKNNIVDALWFEDQVLDFLVEKSGVDKVKNLNLVSHSIYLKATKKEINRAKDKIAVVYAQGEIGGGEGDESFIGSVSTARALRKARLDKNVKAIVFRVNSPGGSTLASDVIWREVKLAQETKPFVVSMGDYAASGGYYISAPADTIVTQSNTITGSIGVFMMFFSAEELIENKIGIHYETVKTSKYADLLSVNRSLNNAEKRKLQMLVDETYGQFLGYVAQGRGLDSLYVDSIGQGRVWSGKRAIELGLADVEGGLDVALEIAAGMAKLEEYRILELPRLETKLEKLLNEFSMTKMKDDIIKDELGDYYQYLQTVKRVQSWKEPQARMEFDLIFD